MTLNTTSRHWQIDSSDLEATECWHNREKKCMKYEAEDPRPRGRPKRAWKEVVENDCQAGKLNKEDSMDRSWLADIGCDIWSGRVWVGECFFSYWPTRVVPDKRPLNDCVRVCWHNTSVVQGRDRDDSCGRNGDTGADSETCPQSRRRSIVSRTPAPSDPSCAWVNITSYC